MGCVETRVTAVRRSELREPIRVCTQLEPVRAARADDLVAQRSEVGESHWRVLMTVGRGGRWAGVGRLWVGSRVGLGGPGPALGGLWVGFRSQQEKFGAVIT